MVRSSNKMKVSIITPVYNAEKHIHRCIKSIISQTYTDYELILIDDGSTDSSSSICDTYAENNDKIKVIHQKNSGPGMSRNTGLLNATGDYILFVDSDDFIFNNTLEILVKKAEENNYPDALIFDYIMGTEEYNIKRNTIIGASEGFIDVKYAILNSSGATCCKMYKKEIITKYSITFPDMYRKEDFVFNKTALSYCDTVFYTTEHMYFYFNNINSIMHTTSYSEKNQNTAFEILDKRISPEYRALVNVLKINNYLIGAMQNMYLSGENIKKIKIFMLEFENTFPNWFERSKEIKLSKEKNFYLFLLNKKKYLILKILLLLRTTFKKFLQKNTSDKG